MRDKDEIMQSIYEFAQGAVVKGFSLWKEYEPHRAKNQEPDEPPKLVYILKTYAVGELSQAPAGVGTGWEVFETYVSGEILIVLWVRESTAPDLRSVN